MIPARIWLTTILLTVLASCALDNHGHRSRHLPTAPPDTCEHHRRH